MFRCPGLSTLCLAFFGAIGLLAGCGELSRPAAPSSDSVSSSAGTPGSPAAERVQPDEHLTESATRPIVSIYAAASLADILRDLQRAFDAQHRSETGASAPLPTVFAVNAGNSGTLARQIEQGGRADIFLSANQEWADYLARQQMLASRFDHIGNRLALVVPRQGQNRIKNLSDLAQPAVRYVAVADPKSAPAGKYAQKCLVETRLWEPLRSKIVVADDVRQALLYVERGEADAGFIYATDARASHKVEVVQLVEEELIGPIQYSCVLLKTGESHPRAVAFYQFLQSPAAASLWRERGFLVSPKGN